MTLPFDDYVVFWEDKEYVIPARQMMGAIAKVEQVVTLSELQVYFQRQAAPLSLLAQAYGAVLRYAGAKVDDQHVYAGMFGAGGADAASTVKTCLFGLLELMVPPAARGNLKARGIALEKSPQSPQSDVHSSKKRSRSASATSKRGSSRRTSSGASTPRNSTGGSQP